MVILISRQGQTRIYGTGANGVRVPSWFGSGRNGSLTVAAGEDYVIDCQKDQEQIYFEFDNLTIEAGAKFRPKHRCNGMVILVRGDFILNGEINVDKMVPCTNDYEARSQNTPQVRLVSPLVKAGAGGKGGNGYTASSGGSHSVTKYNARTSGGDGGVPVWCGGGNGGGGGASGVYWTHLQDSSAWALHPVGNGSTGRRPRVEVGLPYKNPVYTFNSSGDYGTGGNTRQVDSAGRGGEAPGGSGASSYSFTAPGYSTGELAPQSGGASDGLRGDAYGGGAIWIYVKGKVVIGSTAVISANGGNGANSVIKYLSGYSTYCSGAGGGGGGGIIALIHNGDITFEDGYQFIANGGVGGKKTNPFGGTGSWAPDDATNGTDGEAGVPLVASLDEVFAMLTSNVSR